MTREIVRKEVIASRNRSALTAYCTLI
jgi:hypothetical protein